MKYEYIQNYLNLFLKIRESAFFHLCFRPIWVHLPIIVEKRIYITEVKFCYTKGMGDPLKKHGKYLTNMENIHE